jgi:hypothetical protein
MAKKATYKRPPKKPIRYKPADFLRGSQMVGEKYTAWDSHGQGKPDFGKGAGPGEPYREVQKTNRKPPKASPGSSAAKGVMPSQGNVTGPSWIAKGPMANRNDPRIAAIRKRLGWS